VTIAARQRGDVETATKLGGTSVRTDQPAAHVGLLTGGNDKHYAVALASALAEQRVQVDFVASRDLDCPEVHVPRIAFLDLRGDQKEDVPFRAKIVRILKYYARLISYAASCRPKVFHILWNNKFELFDRTLLILYYRVLGKRVVFTAHNVNAAKRDSKDTWLNRLSLRVQYRLCACIFVHTELMKRQLIEEFGVSAEKITIIPYGINVTLPEVRLSRIEARARLGLGPDDKALLFFGQIAPYKGLEFLIDAFARLASSDASLRLVIAGKVKQGSGRYWPDLQERLAREGIRQRVIEHIRFIQDEDIEQYFVSADALVLPYTYIFQSGVLFLAYSFGLPVIVTDVGSLKGSVVEGRTGFVCRPQDAGELADTIVRFFSSELYLNLEKRRPDIRRLVGEQHSWTTVAEITAAAYTKLERAS
jgi:D-inositol-3-phosphate glycosyltransferase